MQIPYFRPALGDAEIDEVVECLRSGWLTTGKRVKRFEQEFAAAVGAPYAVAVNSCTAALHLATEAIGLRPRQAVLVPSMTFAATAEVVRYHDAVPILVDCDPETLNIDVADATRKLHDLASGKLRCAGADVRAVGIVSVHVGGSMIDPFEIREFASKHGLWVVEDAAHAFPAAMRRDARAPWIRCGEDTAAITCFSFYANKTITTGEGGMAVTHDAGLAERMRLMSLHGLSRDAWERYSGGGSWDYKIVAPGFKYNLTDIAGAIGLGQLARAEAMRRRRAEIAEQYLNAFRDVDEFDSPPNDPNRIHSWHLFPIRLRTDRIAISRNEFIDKLGAAGVSCSVHWRPLHLHPYYQESAGWEPDSCPTATRVWNTLISLPLFSDLRPQEVQHVIESVKSTALRSRSVAHVA
jgi:dTDP-4-amino-4,6-dideoxygalactose transaminase